MTKAQLRLMRGAPDQVVLVDGTVPNGPSVYAWQPDVYAVDDDLEYIVPTSQQPPFGCWRLLNDLDASQIAAIVAAQAALAAAAANTILIASGLGTAAWQVLPVTSPLTGGASGLAIVQATAGTDGYVTQAKYNAWDAKMTNPMFALGDMIYGGAAGVPTRLETGAATEVLHGGATPTFDSIVESDLVLADNATNNATAARHGFAPRLSGAAGEYLDGLGNWAVPAGVASVYTAVATNVGGGGGNVNIIHNFGAYPVVQILIGGVVTPPGVGTVTSITHNTVNDFTVAYSGAAVGHILATIGSPEAQQYKTVNADYAVQISDVHIEVATAGKTMTLPTAVGNQGRVFHIDNSSTGDINVVCFGAETIWGQATQIVPPNCCMSCISNGTNYRVF